MKKLLTMMVSCASALFAMADDTWSSGTDFQGYGATVGGPAISLDITKNDSNGEGDKYWYSTATESEAVVTNNGTTTYLMLDTSSVLERTINPWTPGDTPTFAPQDIGTGIYFDSKVQFTATEDGVTPNPGDKLVVWLKAVEGTDAVGTEGEEGYVEPVAGSTNLVITAGNGFYVGGENEGQAIPEDFFTTKSIDSGSWHQLTIKAFVEGDQTYFNVFIDGERISGAPESGSSVDKFQSLVAGGQDGSDTITSVGFRGTGAVDDLLFTNVDPLGFSVTVTIPAVDGADAVAKYSVDGSTWVDVTSGSPFTVPASTQNIRFKVSIADGFELAEGEKNGETDDESGNPVWERTVTGISSVNNAITLTVVKAGQTEPDPGPGTELPKPGTVGGAEITVGYETEAEAAIRAAMDNVGGAFDSPDELVLVVEVNGEVLLGNAAVEMINEVTKVFEIEDGNYFFDDEGKMEVTFKATSADPDYPTYEAKVCGVNATVKDAYQVVPKYINLATGDVIEDPGEDATAKFFKLVIEAKATE